MNDERYELLMNSIFCITNSIAVLLKKCGEQELAQNMYEQACLLDLQISQWKVRDQSAKSTNQPL